MNKIENSYFYSKINKEQLSSKSLQSPQLSYTADTVSFSGKNNKKIGFFDKLLGAKSKDEKETSAILSSENKEIPSVWLNTEGITKEDYNSPLANKLRAMTYETSHHIYDKVSAAVYNENAISTIVKYDKEDPEFADKLASFLKYSAIVDKDDCVLIAKNLKQNPEIVNKFYGKTSENPSSLASYIKAYNVSPDLTEKLSSLTTSNDEQKYCAHHIEMLVKASEEFGEEAILKYASEQRMKLKATDIIELAKASTENSSEIDELIELSAKSGKEEDASFVQIHKLLPSYLKEKDAISKMISLGAIKECLDSTEIESYNIAPKEFEMILSKKQDSSSVYNSFEKVGTQAVKLKEYKNTIEKLSGKSVEELNINQINEIIKELDKTKKKIEEITKRN